MKPRSLLLACIWSLAVTLSSPANVNGQDGNQGAAENITGEIAELTGEVERGSTDNRVTIRVLNTDSIEATGISAQLKFAPQGVTNQSLTPRFIPTLAPGASADLLLTFDVRQNVVAGALETPIRLDVSAAEGQLSHDAVLVFLEVEGEPEPEPEPEIQALLKLTQVKWNEPTRSEPAPWITEEIEYNPDDRSFYLKFVNTNGETSLDTFRFEKIPETISLGQSFEIKIRAELSGQKKHFCSGYTEASVRSIDALFGIDEDRGADSFGFPTTSYAIKGEDNVSVCPEPYWEGLAPYGQKAALTFKFEPAGMKSNDPGTYRTYNYRVKTSFDGPVDPDKEGYRSYTLGSLKDKVVAIEWRLASVSGLGEVPRSSGLTLILRSGSMLDTGLLGLKYNVPEPPANPN